MTLLLTLADNSTVSVTVPAVLQNLQGYDAASQAIANITKQNGAWNDAHTIFYPLAQIKNIQPQS